MPRPLSNAFTSLHFSLVRGRNNKYNAFCPVCKKTLCNTATARLKAHRNKCRYVDDATPALSLISTESVPIKVCDVSPDDYPKDRDPLTENAASEEAESESTNIYHSDHMYQDLDVNMQIVGVENTSFVAKDDNIAFGRYVTSMLMKLDSKTCALAKFKIFETLYNAEIGNLHRDSNT